MWLFEPKNFISVAMERLHHGDFMDCQKRRMDFALANAQSVPNDAIVTAAVELIAEESGIEFSNHELLKILALYPIERAQLAHYGCVDTEVGDSLLDVVSNFVANTRWPTHADNIDIAVFVERLKVSANFMGYKTTSG